MTSRSVNTPVYVSRLHESCKRFKSEPCLTIKHEGKYETWTYNDFLGICNSITSILLNDFRLPKGFRGIVIGENSPQWIAASHAIILAGGSTVPLDPNLPVEEMDTIFEICAPSIIFCTPAYGELMQSLKGAHPCIRHIILLGPNENSGRYPAFEQVAEKGDPGYPAFETSFDPDDATAILFTSGTTGNAKGVVLTQKNFCASIPYQVERLGLDRHTTMLAVLPLYHVFGFEACVAASLLTGWHIVVVPQIKGSLILKAMVDQKVTLFCAVPKMLTLFHESILSTVKSKGMLVYALFKALHLCIGFAGFLFSKKTRISLFKSVHERFGGRLDVIICGGASLDKKTFFGFMRMGFTIIEGYGLTETFGPITVTSISTIKPGSVGSVLPGNELVISRPDASGIGEVLLRGTNVFKEYYKNPTATRQVLDSAGWFHTGDMGRIDKDGSLFLSGRLKDVIVLDSGKNAYPDELEDYYRRSPLIQEIAVFGGRQLNRSIIAALVFPSQEVRKKYGRQKAYQVIHEEVVRLNRNRPSYKKISDIGIVYDPLPITSTKKIKKHECERIYNDLKVTAGFTARIKPALSALDIHTMEQEDFKKLVSLLSTHGDPFVGTMTVHTSLCLDLNIDSLRLIDVICFLEQTFALTIPDHLLRDIDTVGDLYAKIREAKQHPGNKQHSHCHSLKERIAAPTDDSPPVPMKRRRGIARVSLRMGSFLMHRLWGIAVAGMENIPTPGPILFISNHQSYLDAAWILCTLPGSIAQNTFIMGKKELLKNSFLAHFFTAYNMIPIGRGEGDIIGALRWSLTVLKQGCHLLLFPEGTRSPDGTLQEFKGGAAILAAESKATVVPIKIRGADAIVKRKRIPALFTRKTISASITFGKPFTYQSLLSSGGIAPQATDYDVNQKMREIIAAL